MRALVLILLFAFPAVHGATFESYKIVAEIKDGTTEEDYFITIINDAANELKSSTITFPVDAVITSVRDSYGDLKYRAQRDVSLKLSFEFTTPIKPGEKRLLLISLRTNSRLTWKGDYYEFLLVFTPRQDIDDFEFTLKLPPSAVLYSPKKGYHVVVPETELVEDYPTPTLRWNMKLRADNVEVFLVRYKAEKTDYLRLLLSLLAVSLILATVGLIGNRALKIHRRRKALKALKILNERERRVLEEIIKENGIKQYVLLERLGYSKSSLSKILSKLQARGLITKKKIGKINKWYYVKEKL